MLPEISSRMLAISEGRMRRFFFISLSAGFVALFSGQSFAGAGQHLTADSHIKAGPQLYGNAYINLRPDEAPELLKFEASIDNGDGAQFTVVLGPDFATESAGDLITIYDFRFRRLLVLNKADSAFSNNSLFGAWHQRWAFLQNNMGTSGILAAAGLFENPELERYWLEQKNGVAHPQQVAYRAFPKPTIRTVNDGRAKSFFIGDQFVAQAKFSGVEFPSASHARAFAAWLVWSRRAHPQIASTFDAAAEFPASIEMLSRNTGAAPDATPERVRMTLTVVKSGGADFSALADRTPAAPAWEPRFEQSLGALMLAAARGEAPNGPVSGEEYAAPLAALQGNGRPLDVALLAMHASMGCDAPEPAPEICQIATTALRETLPDKNVTVLVDALREDQSGDHAVAAKALIALEALKPSRADVLDIMIANTLVEAKRDGQLDDALSQRFNELPALFERAFAQDPYTPSRYRDYYNYLHASADTTDDSYLVLTKSYPVIDLARSIPAARIPNIVQGVSDVEQRIAADFPAHFPLFARDGAE